MLKLNLPAYQHCLRKTPEGHLLIWDVLRKQYLTLTPEEWVRQHFVHYLLYDRSVPQSLLRLEAPLQYGTLTKWADIVAYDRQKSPFLLVECKASTVRIDQNTLLQLSAYQHTLQASYMALTNGLTHYYMYCGSAGVEWLSALPDFEAM